MRLPVAPDGSDMDINSLIKSNLANSVSLSGCQRQAIKTLPGFQKHHRIPQGDDESRYRFLGKIGAEEIAKDLDSVFHKLRSAFGFKRRELTVMDPIEGSGMIGTPGFDYRIELLLDLDSTEHVVWRRSVNRLQQPDLLFSDSFHSVFGDTLAELNIELTESLDIASIIDHVEDLGGDECSVEYDRDATWCEIRSVDSRSKLRIDGTGISVNGHDRLGPAELFQCYWQLQKQFLATIDLPV